MSESRTFEADGAGWVYPPLIVNVALTGIVPSIKDNPNVPISPSEVATDARRCYDAGARIVHVHARTPEGTATWDPSIYAEIIGRIREECPDVIVCASTSGRNVSEIEKRGAVLELQGPLRPDMASLTLGSLNFPKQASVNPPAVVQELAALMRERGIKPELEVFELGMIDYARYLIDKGVLEPPFYFNLFLGSLGTIGASPANLVHMVNALPEGAMWAATGIGRFQFSVNALAITMEGHVRVGLEDNIWFDAGRTRPATNVDFVKRLVGIAQAIGRPVATADQVREALALRRPRKNGRIARPFGTTRVPGETK